MHQRWSGGISSPPDGRPQRCVRARGSTSARGQIGLRSVLAAFGLVKYERRSIKSWADAQRQPASRARWLSPNGEDVAGPATKRVKPQASRPASL